MTRRQPSSTRTGTRFPYTTLCRSALAAREWKDAGEQWNAPTSRTLAPGEAIEVGVRLVGAPSIRSEEHTSELQSLMRISYAVFCMTKIKSLLLLTYAVRLVTQDTHIDHNPDLNDSHSTLYHP